LTFAEGLAGACDTVGLGAAFAATGGTGNFAGALPNPEARLVAAADLGAAVFGSAAACVFAFGFAAFDARYFARTVAVLAGAVLPADRVV
jgi:hypothetical protein